MSYRHLIITVVFFALFSSFQAEADTTIYIVRHGEKDESKKYDTDDQVPLTIKGHGQAGALAGYLKDANIKKIFVSPKVRTQETAQYLACKLSLNPEQRDEHAKTLLTDLTQATESVLVVSHSQWIPELLTNLELKHKFTANDVKYGDIFIVTLGESKKVKLTKFNGEAGPLKISPARSNP